MVVEVQALRMTAPFQGEREDITEKNHDRGTAWRGVKANKKDHQMVQNYGVADRQPENLEKEATTKEENRDEDQGHETQGKTHISHQFFLTTSCNSDASRPPSLS